MNDTLRIDATRWLPLLEEIASRADTIALRWFGEPRLRVSDKDDGSPVSEADQAIESMARSIVAERFPELGVLGEEEGDSRPPRGTARLIVDPIDGTRNFVRGIPIFAALLAIEVDGAVIAGVVSAPALRARWSAARGVRGVPRRETDSRLVDRRPVARSSVSRGSKRAFGDGAPERLRALFHRVERTRGFGDFYQHMLVAEGAGEIAIDPKMKPWDIAAVKIVVEEAGGRSTSFAGEDTIEGGTLISSNGLLHAALVAALAD